MAAVPYGSRRALDIARKFTPGGRYRDTIELDGRLRIVREPDGIYLNDAGADVAPDLVLEALWREFERP